MSMDIKKIFEYIDSIGVEESNRRITQYEKEVDGVNAQEFFNIHKINQKRRLK